MSDIDDYAPFPEAELEELAAHFENVANAWSPQTPDGLKLRDEQLQWAGVCRNAVRCFNAVRERMLLNELQRDYGETHGAD